MKLGYLYTSTIVSLLFAGGNALTKSAKAAKKTLEKAIDAISPATTFPNLPEECRGVVPNMLGEFRFFGFRLQGVPAANQSNLANWTEGLLDGAGNYLGGPREIGGIEWVPWVDGPYYVLAINSPAGLVRRFCTFDAKDYRTSVCTGMDARDETATETLYVTETDEDCNAMSFSIITTKAWTKDDTEIANIFVDNVEGVRTGFEFPKTPAEVDYPRRKVASFQGKVNYKWNSRGKYMEEKYIQKGKYNPAVNVITGIKIKPGVLANPEATVIFLAVPRWFGGVPSTLNKITVDLTSEGPFEDPVLEPFPSWDMQEVGNCDKIQYVQSMEIDNDGNMWVIDSGRLNVFATPDNTCPPKLLIIDTETGELVDEPYIFPNAVAPYDETFLNDIALDNRNGGVAYISDMFTPGLIVYRRASRTSDKFSNISMFAEQGLNWQFREEDLGDNAFAVDTNGVTLSPNGEHLYYTTLQGLTLYSVSTAALINNDADWADNIVNHGNRTGFTDGMTMDCEGNLYHSDLNNGAIYSWNITSPDEPSVSGKFVAGNDDDMWWTDTYAWDDAGYLWVTANFLPTVFGASDSTVPPKTQQFEQMNIFRISTAAAAGYQAGDCST